MIRKKERSILCVLTECGGGWDRRNGPGNLFAAVGVLRGIPGNGPSRCGKGRFVDGGKGDCGRSNRSHPYPRNEVAKVGSALAQKRSVRLGQRNAKRDGAQTGAFFIEERIEGYLLRKKKKSNKTTGGRE